MLAGLWNGFLVAYVGVQPIIATLILMVAGRGIAQLIIKGQIVIFIHEAFEFVGGGFLAGPAISGNSCHSDVGGGVSLDAQDGVGNVYRGRGGESDCKSLYGIVGRGRSNCCSTCFPGCVQGLQD